MVRRPLGCFSLIPVVAALTCWSSREARGFNFRISRHSLRNGVHLAAAMSMSEDGGSTSREGFLRPSTFNKEGNAADITILSDDDDEEEEEEEEEEEKEEDGDGQERGVYFLYETNDNSNSGDCISTQQSQNGDKGLRSGSPGSKVSKNIESVLRERTDDSAVDFFGQSKRGDLLLDNEATDRSEAGFLATESTSSSATPSSSSPTLVEAPASKTSFEPLVIESDADVEELLRVEGLPSALRTPYPFADPTRGVFCSRTLNMRSIQVIGYDMDYTLVRYRVSIWEERAYHYAKEWLRDKGFWVSGLDFVNDLVVRGLVVDREEGNILKVDRFGYVRDAMHGTKRLSMNQIQSLYGRQVVDLRESRWSFLNTLFSVSEATLYLQLVDRLDDGSLLARSVAPFEPNKCDTYSKLFSAVSKSVFRAHVTSKLKSDVLRDPAKYVEVDSGLVRTLVDQRLAGKKLALITNSDWHYTNTIMSYIVRESSAAEARERGASDSSVGPVGGRKWKDAPTLLEWRSLFDVVVVSARKPDFFTGKMPVYEIVTESFVRGIKGEGDVSGDDSWCAPSECDGSSGDDSEVMDEELIEEGHVDSTVDAETLDYFTTAPEAARRRQKNMVTRGIGTRGSGNNQEALMQEVFKLGEGRVYSGGTARLIEKLFRVSRERILYVGDHVFSDVSIAKATNRWRTLLVLQELEDEVAGVALSHATRRELKVLLSRKDRLADVLNHLRTVLRRIESRGAPDELSVEEVQQCDHHQALMQRILAKLVDLDVEIEARLQNYGSSVNKNWGFMSRAGFSDKSHIMRQMEKYADVYTSRVSNLLRYTPYAYFRAGQQSLAHDGDDLAGFLSEIESRNHVEP